MKYNRLIGLLVVGIFQISVLTAGAETIRMGYFEIRPHMYKSEVTGRAAGAAVTYLEMVAKKMGCNVSWIGPLPHARLVQYLKKGEKIDGDPIMSMNSERQKFLFYPSTPFYLAKPNFIVTRNNFLKKIDSVDDVKGYVIGQFNKAANSKFVIENESFFKFQIISAGSMLFEQQIKKLILGRIDAIHTLDEYTLMYEAKRLNLDEKVRILFLPEPPIPFFTVFCKNEKGKILTEKYDIAKKDLGFTSDDYNELIQHEFNLLTQK
jgi:ABC-type amino acid transport substrate-binding protein